MADEETTADEAKVDGPEPDGGEVDGDNAGSDEAEKENNRPDDTLAENKTCPECGEPVDDVRATCINCGYEYKEEDHEDLEAGSEFTAGSQIDDEGNELPQDGSEEQTEDEAED